MRRASIAARLLVLTAGCWAGDVHCSEPGSSDTYTNADLPDIGQARRDVCCCGPESSDAYTNVGLPDIEQARRDVNHWSKLYRVGQVNGINPINRGVNRLDLPEPGSLAWKYRRRLLEAQERLEHLEALLAGQQGPPPTISSNVVRRSRVNRIGAEFSGVVARAFCEPGEVLVTGDYYAPKVPGARVHENRRFVFPNGGEAWQIYVTKPVGVGFDVIVHADCKPPSR